MTTKEHLIAILAEEGVEVAQRATKALRFGLTEIQPGQTLNNAERITQEFADLCGIYELSGLPPPSRDAIQAKKAKVLQFLGYSKECGTVDAS